MCMSFSWTSQFFFQLLFRVDIFSSVIQRFHFFSRFVVVLFYFVFFFCCQWNKKSAHEKNDEQPERMQKSKRNKITLCSRVENNFFYEWETVRSKKRGISRDWQYVVRITELGNCAHTHIRQVLYNYNERNTECFEWVRIRTDREKSAERQRETTIWKNQSFEDRERKHTQTHNTAREQEDIVKCLALGKKNNNSK